MLAPLATDYYHHPYHYHYLSFFFVVFFVVVVVVVATCKPQCMCYLPNSLGAPEGTGVEALIVRPFLKCGPAQ